MGEASEGVNGACKPGTVYWLVKAVARHPKPGGYEIVDRHPPGAATSSAKLAEQPAKTIPP